MIAVTVELWPMWLGIFLTGVVVGAVVGFASVQIGRRGFEPVYRTHRMRPYRRPRCTGCFIDHFQFHHDIKSDCPVHDVVVMAREGGMIRLDGERWYLR